MINLLDTSALLAHYRDESGAVQVQTLFEDDESEVLLASVSLPEFARRLRDLGASHPETCTVLEQYLHAVDTVVAVDQAVALVGFDLICQTPERLPMIDALIAAAACSRNARLVHRDRHMGAIPASRLPQLYLNE